MTWLVVANSSNCRIFDQKKKNDGITLVKELNHASSKMKNTDLVSDGPGHYNKGNMSRGSYSPDSTPKEQEISNFSKEISTVLNMGRKMNEYDSLIVVAPDHMHGLINEHLDHHVKSFITMTINKDYGHLNERDLLVAIEKERE